MHLNSPLKASEGSRCSSELDPTVLSVFTELRVNVIQVFLSKSTHIPSRRS